MNTDAYEDRPGGWLGGYGPSGSPIREGGVQSPKKKLHNWPPNSSMPASMPDIVKPSLADSDDEEVVEVDETETEDVVEEVFESDSAESEYEEEIVEESDSDDSDLEAIPPPIEIPNELRPAHLREQDKPKKVDIDSDSSDSSDEEETIPEAPRAQVSSMRPSAMRGHSFDDSGSEDGVPQSSPRGGRRPNARDAEASDSSSEGDDNESKESIPEAPRVQINSMRPTVVRGHSFDTDDAPFVEAAARSGKRPTAKQEKVPEPKPVQVPVRKSVVSQSVPAPAPSKSAASAQEHYEDEKKDFAWEKPSWAKQRVLKKTGAGEVLQKEGNLAKPITSLPHQSKDGPFEKPKWTGGTTVKPTGKAEVLKKEGNLAKPITALPHTGEKDLSWQKPDWTKKVNLRGTTKGEALKSGKEIARPIGGIKPADD